MTPGELVTAGVVLLGTLGVGTVVHELSHALALTTFGIPYEIRWLPTTDDDTRPGLARALASVTPRAASRDLSPWALRTAAVMPLILATPVLGVFVGVVPDPIAGGDAIGTAMLIGWLACARPSPGDFSLFWYAERAIDDFGVGEQPHADLRD